MLKIVAHSPTLKPSGCFAHRIVLAAKLDTEEKVQEYVVWTENIQDDGTHRDYFHGDYFTTRYSNASALHNAHQRFAERSQIHMQQTYCSMII